MRKSIICVLIVFLALISIGSVAGATGSDDALTVLFLNVGQGDSSLVMCGDEVMLIDGGSSGCSSLLYSLLKNTLGITHLDYIIATHPHEDHIGGIPGALNACSVGTLYSPVTEYDAKCFESMLEYAARYGVEPTIPTVGDTFTIGTATVEFLSPNQNILWATDVDVNDLSIVVRITYGDTAFLFMGDAESRGESCSMKYASDISADVLKVGHHGSDYSSSETFLENVMPEYAIISVGIGNRYGLPNDKTIDRLNAIGATILRTDTHGNVGCISDGSSVTFYTGDILPQMGLGAASPAKPTPTATATAPETVQPTQNPIQGTEDPDVGTDAGQTSFICNTNSRKFHSPSCSSADDISPQNRMEYTGSRDDLVADGYAPCKRCNP